MKQKRPPVIAVVGHIDHGKSRLQRALRNTDSHFREAGDITQHIGAYELHAVYEGGERRATIIDTPGHEAFSHIREHGLELADVALLVVSAEEGWREQSAETLAHIQQTGTPYIVVFTKIDTERADAERAKQSVLAAGVMLEGLGGDVPWVAVSSVTAEGIADLVELIFLTTDVYDIIEDRQDGSVGVLVEADIDRTIGIAGTVILLAGELSNSGYVQIGESVAPLRIMKNDRGETVSSVTPSSPVRIFGFSSVPPIGEAVFLHADKKGAVDAAKAYQPAAGVDGDASGAVRVVPIVLRSDTASGLTSIEQALAAVPVAGIAFRIIKKAVGAVTEEDVRLALSQEGGAVVGFHTTADRRAQALGERSGIALHLFPTIYELIDWAQRATERQQVSYEMDNPTGSASVIRVFSSQPAQGSHIIGLQITDGSFHVGQQIAVVKQGLPAGRFTVASIEQRNQEQDSVSGVKTQFAARVTGDGVIAEKDAVVGLPDLTS